MNVKNLFISRGPEEEQIEILTLRISAYLTSVFVKDGGLCRKK